MNKMPDLEPLLIELPKLISSEQFHEKASLRMLFYREFGILKLRDTIQAFDEKIRYDCDNRNSSCDRRNRLVLLSLVLEDKDLLRQLVEHVMAVDQDHRDFQRYYMSVPKSDLGEISFSKSCRSVLRDMSDVFAEMSSDAAEIYRMRLEQFLNELMAE